MGKKKHAHDRNGKRKSTIFSAPPLKFKALPSIKTNVYLAVFSVELKCSLALLPLYCTQ